MDGTVFNQVTNLLDYDGYKKKVQESTEIYEYQTTKIFPQPICYMKGQALQGFDVKEAPPKLIDVESYLLTQPLREEIGHYTIDENVRNKEPELPSILQTRLMIPDCKELLETKYDRIHHEDVWNREYNYGPSQFALTTEPSKQQYVASPGIDTRMTMKDAYKKRQDEKFKGTRGETAGDITPAPEVKCDIGSSDLGCMHLFGPDAANPADLVVKQLQPSVSIGHYAQQLGVGSSAPSGVSSETLAVAATIDPRKRLFELVEEQAKAAACGTKFYTWKAPC